MRRGPTRRVRNRRNVDPSQVPLPYPEIVFATPLQILGGTNEFLLIAFYDATTGAALPMDRAGPINFPLDFVVNGVTRPIAAEWDAAGPDLVLTLTYPISLMPNDPFTIPPWCNSARGIRGEWMLPFIGTLP